MSRPRALFTLSLVLMVVGAVAMFLADPWSWIGLGALLLGTAIWPVALLARRRRRSVGAQVSSR